MADAKKPPYSLVNLMGVVVVPILAIITVPYYWINFGFNSFEWGCCIVFILLCALGITAGYHRMWAHKTYKGNFFYRLFWAYWGACAAQNTIIEWASDHRNHHKDVDNIKKDPYCIKKGFFFAHMGWIIRDYRKNDFSNVEDLYKDKIVVWQHRHYMKILVFSNFVVPLILGYFNYAYWGGNFWGVFILAGLFRFVFNHQATFLINSACHYFGTRPYSKKDSSRDNFLLAILTFGEGYHNYHHTFQSDYRNGVKWWHYDPTKWFIYICSLFGLTSNLKRVSENQIMKQKQFMAMENSRDKFYRKFNILPSNEIYTQIEKALQECKEALNEWVLQYHKIIKEVKQKSLAQKNNHLKELKNSFLRKKEEYQKMLNQFSLKLQLQI